MSTRDDPHNLQRFVEAQERDYATALRELHEGRKRSHWIWYVFPQLAGLGFSSTSRYYAIQSSEEAADYLAHPLLGARLVECGQALLAHREKSALQILGSPDDMKVRSCATLFACISPGGSVFHRVLETFYSGAPDEKTLQLLGRDSIS